jgi:hypothetical protein
LSALTAGVIVTLVSPVTAGKAAVMVISVNRIIKGDRLSLPPITQPTQHDAGSTKKPTPERTLLGCESAFSPFTDPTRGRLVTHCVS